MPEPSILFMLVLAAILILICFALWAKVAKLSERLSGRNSELESIRRDYDHTLTSAQELTAHLQEEVALRSAAESRTGRISELEIETERLNAQINTLQDTIVSLTSKLSQSETRREEENRTAEKTQALLTEARAEFGVQFENLANKILEEKSKTFTEQNQLNLNSLLQPLGTQIKEFKEKVERTYDEESQQRASLRAEIERLCGLNERMDQDAINLTNALRGQSKALGNWGEFVLEEILQKAGLTKDREYSVRETLTAADGKRSQPDVVIVLPEGRHLVIDSKTNLVSYLRYSASEDESERKAELKKHIAGIRTHLRELDVKSYQDHYKLNSLDFVLMFIPLEPAFIVAVRQDLTLFDDAFAKRIVIVCPSTLLATMRTIRNIWRQEQQKQNVLEIANQSGALYDKFVGFVEDLNDVGDRLRQAQQSYDGAHNKLTSGKGNLISRAERMLQLGAKASKRLQQNLIEAATESEEIETPGTIVSLDEGRLFHELVAPAEPDEEDEVLPLLSSKSATGQG
jgi:DNA recombination protein RmuC